MKPIRELLNFSVINIDKPVGPTSFTVSEFVKRKLSEFGISKTSHMGTLDPAVSGVLPVTIGRACRLAGFLLGERKTYIGILHCHKEQGIGKLQEIINKNFTGKIKQTPPVKSAVKRQEREREVYRFELLEESENKKDFLFIADVEGGTYIRKLCSDLGEMIGGANMLELRRIKAGLFDESSLVSLYDFEKAVEELKKGNEKLIRKMLFTAEDIIKRQMPFVEVKKQCVKALLTGKPLFERDIVDLNKLPAEGHYAVFSDNKFVEIAKRIDDWDRIGKAEFVFD